MTIVNRISYVYFFVALASLGLLAVFLVGNHSLDSGGDLEPIASAKSSESPTRGACTIGLDATTGTEYFDIAVVECGGESSIVAGDFRHRVKNYYNPETAGGIESVEIVGDERRATIRDEDFSCQIIWQEGGDPTICE